MWKPFLEFLNSLTSSGIYLLLKCTWKRQVFVWFLNCPWILNFWQILVPTVSGKLTKYYLFLNNQHQLNRNDEQPKFLSFVFVILAISEYWIFFFLVSSLIILILFGMNFMIAVLWVIHFLIALCAVFNEFFADTYWTYFCGDYNYCMEWIIW